VEGLWRGEANRKGKNKRKKKKRTKKELIFFDAKPKTTMPSCRVWSPYGHDVVVIKRGDFWLVWVAPS
jgi:hypothetical protein